MERFDDKTIKKAADFVRSAKENMARQQLSALGIPVVDEFLQAPVVVELEPVAPVDLNEHLAHMRSLPFEVKYDATKA